MLIIERVLDAIVKHGDSSGKNVVDMLPDLKKQQVYAAIQKLYNRGSLEVSGVYLDGKREKNIYRESEYQKSLKRRKVSKDSQTIDKKNFNVRWMTESWFLSK
ncbi:MAG: hypothetical protein KAS32_07185 [Candidatus Peribacteraceae bacterium]|nr:hypothetical protein [Candidatus Peribacteraceae bacterium]